MAVVTDVDIVNMALDNIGTRSKIEAIDESSAESAQAGRWYEPSRQLLLSLYDWNFAHRRKSLATHPDAAPIGWCFRYAMPADDITVRKFEPVAGLEDLHEPFKIEMSIDGTEKTLLFNREEAVLEYTDNVTDPTLFSIGFIDTFAALLGWRMVPKLAPLPAIADRERTRFFQTFALHTAVNANEGKQDDPAEAPWIAAR